MTLPEIIESAHEHGVELEPRDFGQGYLIDGMEPEEWLEAMTNE